MLSKDKPVVVRDLTLDCALVKGEVFSAITYPHFSGTDYQQSFFKKIAEKFEIYQLPHTQDQASIQQSMETSPNIGYKNKSTKNKPTKAYILRTNHYKSIEYASVAAATCEKIGLPWEYFQGYQDKSTQEIEEIMSLPSDGKLDCDNGACCTAGHFALWRKILENRETAIILEHDALMMQPVDIDIPDNMIVALGYKFFNVDMYDYQKAGLPSELISIPNHAGAHAYALTYKTCELLFNEIESNGTWSDVDRFYFLRNTSSNQSNIPLTIASPTPAICWVRDSTIGWPPGAFNFDLIPSFVSNCVCQ
jgi:GR25 family glycosyltransferase involved in LPS biosynthesis